MHLSRHAVGRPQPSARGWLKTVARRKWWYSVNEWVKWHNITTFIYKSVFILLFLTKPKKQPSYERSCWFCYMRGMKVRQWLKHPVYENCDWTTTEYWRKNMAQFRLSLFSLMLFHPHSAVEQCTQWCTTENRQSQC